MPTGAQLFVSSLEELGIKEIFTVVGDHLNEVLSVAGRQGFRITDMRHESGVTHAADIVARSTRRPAVSMVTGGPGHTNSLTGLAAAFLAGSPLISVSGAAPAAPAGRQGFQVIDQVGMAKPVTKWAAQPTGAAQIPYLVGRAYAEAMAGRRGPVHLSIPADLFTSEVDSALPMPKPPPEPHAPEPSGRDVETALSLLKKATRPIVIGGSGVWWSDAGGELKKFLSLSKLPYYSITMARGVIPDGKPHSMGYADPALNRAVLEAFPDADVVLVLGKRLDSRVALGGPKLFAPEAKVIQVDIHPQELGLTRNLELGICADVKATLRAFNDVIGKKGWPGHKTWLRHLKKLRKRWTAKIDQAAADVGVRLHPAVVFAEMRKALPSVLISWDGGDFVHWGRVSLPAVRPGGWMRLGPLAGIGAGLPNAVGLQLANPKERVLMVTGDGSLGFFIAELDTLVRHNLPVVIVVGNDAGWGVERELQGAVQGTNVACELRRTRYDLVMEAFGGEGENIDERHEIGPAIHRAFASRKPYLLNVNIRGVRSPFAEWAIQRKQA